MMKPSLAWINLSVSSEANETTHVRGPICRLTVDFTEGNDFSKKVTTSSVVAPIGAGDSL